MAGASRGEVPVWRGIAWILLATLLFVGTGVLAKHLTGAYPVTQVVWARYAFHLLLMLLVFRQGILGLIRDSRRPGLQVGRALCLLAATGLSFAALARMPIADFTALIFLGPILLTAFSVPMLGESVGTRRWIAVAVGFAGALIIVRPGSGLFQQAAWIAVAVALFDALYTIATRSLSRTDPVLTTLAFTAAVGTLVTTLAVPVVWIAPDGQGLVLMAALGVAAGTGHFAYIKGVTIAPVSVAAPFLYAELVWAIPVGFLAFGDFPDGWTLAGAAVVAGSGLYLLRGKRPR